MISLSPYLRAALLLILLSQSLNNSKAQSTSIIKNIQDGKIDIALEQFSASLDDNQLNNIVSLAYGKKMENGEKIIDFASRLPSYALKEICFTGLLDEIERNNHVDYNTRMFTLAFKVKQIMDSSNFDALNADLKNNYIILKDRFPVAVKTILWEPVCIKSVFFNEPLIAAEDAVAYDRDRRYVITWGGGKVDNGADEWIFEPNVDGRFFAIKSKLYQEYMYAAANDLTLDHSRRRIFTWRAKSAFDAAEWELQPIRNGTGMYIRNKNLLEYVYPVQHSNDLLDRLRRLVFSWRKINESPRGDSQYDWLVNKC